MEVALIIYIVVVVVYNTLGQEKSSPVFLLLFALYNVPVNNNNTNISPAKKNHFVVKHSHIVHILTKIQHSKVQ